MASMIDNVKFLPRWDSASFVCWLCDILSNYGNKQAPRLATCLMPPITCDKRTEAPGRQTRGRYPARVAEPLMALIKPIATCPIVAITGRWHPHVFGV
jgi:hypothetical protein